MSQEPDRTEKDNEALQLLAEMCESGMLEKPRVTDNGNMIRYRMTEKYMKRLNYLLSRPELWEKPELQGCKLVLEQLAAFMKRVEDRSHND